MTTTITFAGFLLLGIAVSMTIASIYGKDETKRQHHSVSADVYFAAFILLIGLYSSKPKVINSLPIKTDTVIVRDTILTHAPTGEDIIIGINPRYNGDKIK